MNLISFRFGHFGPGPPKPISLCYRLGGQTEDGHYPIQQLFVFLVPIQQLFPFYHNPQSRGITGLLDMKRLLFAQMGRGTIQWGAFTSGKIQWGAFTITGLLDMKHLLFGCERPKNACFR